MELINSCEGMQGVIRTQGKKIPDEFKYLTSLVPEDRKMKEEIGHRIQTGWRNWELEFYGYATKDAIW